MLSHQSTNSAVNKHTSLIPNSSRHGTHLPVIRIRLSCSPLLSKALTSTYVYTHTHTHTHTHIYSSSYLIMHTNTTHPQTHTHTPTHTHTQGQIKEFSVQGCVLYVLPLDIALCVCVHLRHCMVYTADSIQRTVALS